MKNGKSPEEDGLTAEMFKWGGEKMKEELVKLFSMCLRQREKYPQVGIMLLSFYCTRKGTKIASKTTDQLVYCQFYTKYSQKLF